jgi:hypothetical protein
MRRGSSRTGLCENKAGLGTGSDDTGDAIVSKQGVSRPGAVTMRRGRRALPCVKTKSRFGDQRVAAAAKWLYRNKARRAG